MMQVVSTRKESPTGYFEAFFMNASMSIFFIDLNGIIHAVNPFALSELGYRKESELKDKKIETLLPIEYHNRYETYYKTYLKNPFSIKKKKKNELCLLKKDGTTFSAEISFSQYKHEGKHYIIIFLNNTSAQRNAEDKFENLNNQLETIVEQRTKELLDTINQLKKSKEKLDEASAIHKAVLENAGAIIISTNTEGIIQSFNPEAEKCSGYKADEVIGKLTPIAFRCQEELKQRAIQFSKELGETINPGFETYTAKAKRNIQQKDEWIFVRKDGSRFPVSKIVTALRNKKNEITGYIGVAVDISELKQVEENLRRSLQKEKELNELKSRFVSMASHEFRTPLSTILSSAYLIEKYTSEKDQPKRERHLQRIIASVNMLTDILNDFLNVGKIEEGKIYTRISEFNIRQLITVFTEEIKHTLKNGQTINYIHEGNQMVWLDTSIIRHILMNLVSNASKFSSENKTIEISTICHNETLFLKVKDNGIGISKEDQKHLMERFFRGANVADVQGTGLGLHIVAKYTEILKGTIEYKSELGKGTEFIITFNTKTGLHEKDTAD
ncbi:MAG: PAS domain S-box protein [Bacteroidetes bacterium]|nr:PAS domain S-box protein [Bacteroidota bacterium]